ncbi:MAG: 4Fe-4S dicluster domain-containing protein [Bacteroidia bacterium]|nr:4Fe-4S dicluster domain-containing protein [Bacteroidia bacterium]
MDTENKLLKKASLQKLIEKLNADGKKILAPVIKGKRVEFGLITSSDQMADDYIVTNQSVKSVAFPKFEKLFSYEVTKEGITQADTGYSTFPEFVILGARPCDANALGSIGAIFNWDYHDKLYFDRLEKTTMISTSCSKCDDYCFCTSAGGHPGSTKGSDIQLTRLETGDYFAEILTEKGKKLTSVSPDLFETAPSVDKSKYLAEVPVKFKVDEAVAKVKTVFENELWLDQSLRCIGCGACAFVCPTCACFDIQDETKGKNGIRLRCWDSCGLSLFTLHTSGHNPREVQSQRWRQRIMHKFAYMPERQNVTGCVGCGRCSRACPVDMNIMEHLINIVEVK